MAEPIPVYLVAQPEKPKPPKNPIRAYGLYLFWGLAALGIARILSWFI